MYKNKFLLDEIYSCKVIFSKNCEVPSLLTISMTLFEFLKFTGEMIGCIVSVFVKKSFCQMIKKISTGNRLCLIAFFDCYFIILQIRKDKCSFILRNLQSIHCLLGREVKGFHNIANIV